MPKTKDLEFNISMIIQRRELYATINGKNYLYIIDGALLNSFKDLYYISPARALQFLKAHCERWERI